MFAPAEWALEWLLGVWCLLVSVRSWFGALFSLGLSTDAQRQPQTWQSSCIVELASGR